MADFYVALQRLSQHLATVVAERQPDVKIVWANRVDPAQPFNTKSQEWVRMTFRPIESRAAAIGNSLYRGLGLLDLQIFTPLGKGAGANEVIARSLQEAMREPIEGIFVGPATFGTAGEAEGWYTNQIRFRVTIDEAAA